MDDRITRIYEELYAVNARFVDEWARYGEWLLSRVRVPRLRLVKEDDDSGNKDL